MLIALLLLTLAQQATTCKDVEVCRAEALIAHASGDFERFHDLAWEAYRKGKPNDPDLMLLVARAQSLSGRPGDALVMLERIAALGSATDAPTSDDFAKVRALPRWPEVEAKLAAAPPSSASASPKPTADKPDSAKASASPRPATDKPADKPTEPADKPAEKPADKPADKPTATPSAKTIRFATLMTPSALAYDRVSRRFIIGDREARRIAVIDENSGQVATFIGAQGAMGDIGGLAIDPQVGDLWVVSSDGDAATLHKVQLISGRVLTTVPVTGMTDRIVALTFAKGAGLVLADANGVLWRLRTSGRAEKLLALEYVPRALAADGSGRLYVSAGGPRLARFTLSPSIRRTGVVELDEGVPSDMPFAVDGDRLHVIVPDGGAYEIRSIEIRR